MDYGRIVSAVPTIFRSRKKLIIILILILAACIIGYAALTKQTPEQKAAKELAAAEVAVGKLMILPDGQPILATVTDADSLKKQQAFFSKAQNGDELLLFPQSLQAVLYSPSRNVIVNVGPVQQTPPSAATTQTSPATSAAMPTIVSRAAAVSVELRNGAGATGAASTAKQALAGNNAFSVVSVGDAANTHYKKSLVVELGNGLDPAAVSALAAQFNASVVSALPNGEAPSSAQVVVILGSSYIVPTH